MKKLYVKRSLAFSIDWIIGFSVFQYLSHYGPGVIHEYAINPGLETFKSLGFWMAFFWPFVWFFLKDLMFFGASVGKLIMGIRVVDKNTHKKAKISQLIIRNLLLATAWVEIIMMFANKGFRLGDIVAKTEVVLKKDVEKQETGDGRFR